MDLTKARILFFDESRELCGALEAALLDREQYPANTETYNPLFRTAHTIKGSAGVFGLEAIVHFAHAMENVLERLRGGHIPLSDALVSLLLRCNDHLRTCLDIGETGETAATQDTPEGTELLAQLKHYQQEAPEPTDDAAPAPEPASAPVAPGARAQNAHWQLSLRFHAGIFRAGFDPLAFVTYLQRLGTLHGIETVWRPRPSLAELDPTECFFGLDLALESAEDASRIRDAFEFVREDSLIGILPPHAPLHDFHALAQTLHERCAETIEAQLARWLARAALTPAQADAVRHGPPFGTPPPPPPPEAAAGEPPAEDPLDTSAPSGAGHRHPVRGESPYMRIEAAKLDRLINRVGELVIAAAGTTLLTQQRQDAELLESIAAINALVENIRDDALTLRMVPVGDVFGRFPRLVRETAQLLGKSIKLEIKGADTEIDKSMVEKLADPLMHIVRNALDHGLEPGEARVRAGKPETGTVTLNAYHDAGTVVIEIRDDGGGIPRDKVLAQAVQRGLAPEGRALSDQETLQLILLPGFSTAEAVSDLSGRGVGMDVVKRSIEALRGVVEMQSHAGEGTVFRLRLPLTLAIIDGFQVEVDHAMLVMPLDMMIECVDMPAGSMQQHARQVNVRGAWLPFVSLRELFGLPAATGNEFVVIVHFGENRAGIVVDRLLGEVQAVIKPLGDIFQSLRGISGSTILGNGRPALVLDIPQLIQQALRREQRQVRAVTGPGRTGSAML